ncbi:MAG: hypothetical protein QF743_02805 [Candidatus Marinimicrobia bacterium]|jgi:hypothetical protein|nr:hypothetical protein [Candidatus Neomarinimicrobiota bacterium]|tara:strand:+ start:961 stop:1863 length:903 start_codon:yes stop_codon:yes gene_type:complete
MKILLFLFLFIHFTLSGQDTPEPTAQQIPSPLQTQEQAEGLIEVETKDGNIFLGTLLEETEDNYKIKTNDGIEINVPKSSVKSFNAIATAKIGDEVWRADPNKSMYLFAPSAFPIENNKSYCRDYCLFFPSYNRGFGNGFSLQLGAFILPGMDFIDLPITITGKYSLPQIGPARFAAGMMYISVPGDDISFGTGIAFGTATLGNRFNHFSASLGWGYFRDEDEWEFSDEPMVVLAGNSRISNSMAIVFEYWKFPNADIEDLPLMVSARFIGRKFAVDLGAILSKNMEGIPPPLLNFTYHM